MASNPLTGPLNENQVRLLRVIYEPFEASGQWPVWQYVDLTLDSRYSMEQAAEVLASLPGIGEGLGGSQRYGLTWRQDSDMQPQPNNPVALTMAGLRHLPESAALVEAFVTTIRCLTEQQRNLVPMPDRVVEATVTSAAIIEEIAGVMAAGKSRLRPEALIDKLREMLGKEPFLHAAINRPNSMDWEVRVPAVLRAYRGIATAEDYLDRLAELVEPAQSPSVPPSFSALDIPYAVGYLDAVWMNRTGCHLFVNLDPASVARLTLACQDQEDFNSLMSALADVLGQVAVPDQPTPKQKAALEGVQAYVLPQLGPDAAARAESAFTTLIQLRRIRASTQHSDARHRAVTALEKIGLQFPPPSWSLAWAHIATVAKGALDVLREEIHAGLADPRG